MKAGRHPGLENARLIATEQIAIPPLTPRLLGECIAITTLPCEDMHCGALKTDVLLLAFSLLGFADQGCCFPAPTRSFLSVSDGNWHSNVI